MSTYEDAAVEDDEDEENDEDDSGWTTTDTESFTSDPEEGGRDWLSGDEYGEEDGEDEEDRMTVPLQPFNHAVGGHSSIYKFTRRAVCKVGLKCDIENRSSADQIYHNSPLSVGKTCSMRRSKDLLRPYSPSSHGI